MKTLVGRTVRHDKRLRAAGSRHRSPGISASAHIGLGEETRPSPVPSLFSFEFVSVGVKPHARTMPASLVRGLGGVIEVPMNDEAWLRGQVSIEKGRFGISGIPGLQHHGSRPLVGLQLHTKPSDGRWRPSSVHHPRRRVAPSPQPDLFVQPV